MKPIIVIVIFVLALLGFTLSMVVSSSAEEVNLGTCKGFEYRRTGAQMVDGAYRMDVKSRAVSPEMVKAFGDTEFVKHIQVKHGEIYNLGGSPLDIEFDVYTRPGTWGHAVLASLEGSSK